jgi:hypothetical protein
MRAQQEKTMQTGKQKNPFIDDYLALINSRECQGDALTKILDVVEEINREEKNAVFDLLTVAAILCKSPAIAREMLDAVYLILESVETEVTH